MGSQERFWEKCHLIEARDMSTWRKSGPEGGVGCSRGAKILGFICPKD